MKEEIDEAMSHMTQEEIIGMIPHLFDELANSLPIEGRAEFNVIRIKLEKAIANGDMDAIEQLQKQYNAHKDPTKPESGLMAKFFNMFK